MRPDQDIPLRLIQISDCHISEDPSLLYRGLDPVAGLKRVVQKASDWKPDLVLATGDLSEDGSEGSYRRISGLLSQFGVPVLALPGNHDDCGIMQRYFPSGPWAGPHATSTESWTVVMLDSTMPGEVHGSFTRQKLAELKHVLERSGSAHVLLALHHQPVLVGAHWIDRYPLRPAEQLWDVTDQAPQVRCVIWGHIHHDFRAARAGMKLLGAPSTAANSLPGTEKFELDQRGPACRWMELFGDGSSKEGILFADSQAVQ